MWIQPKTDWMPGEGIKANDFNRIEGNIEHLSQGIEEDIRDFERKMFDLVQNRFILEPHPLITGAAAKRIYLIPDLRQTHKLVIISYTNSIDNRLTGLEIRLHSSSHVIGSNFNIGSGGRIYTLDSAPEIILSTQTETTNIIEAVLIWDSYLNHNLGRVPQITIAWMLR